MGSELSHELQNLGFFPALGTLEGLKEEKLVPVKPGLPYTYDKNNGVTVVFDEKGHPWIRSRWDNNKGVVKGLFKKMIHAHSLDRGAHVPHSNDGGLFIRENRV